MKHSLDEIAWMIILSVMVGLLVITIIAVLQIVSVIISDLITHIGIVEFLYIYAFCSAIFLSMFILWNLND